MSVSLALLAPCATNSAGLGRLAILSALGQPLNAEIELLAVQKGETVVAKLASPDTYQQANLPFNAALLGTRVTVEKRPNGQPYLKATTPRPINEPFIELVVELSSEHGRVTRQYTILLDPPGYGRAAAEVPPPVAAAPAPRAPAVQASQEPAASVAPAPQELEPPASSLSEAEPEVAPSAAVPSPPTPISGAATSAQSLPRRDSAPTAPGAAENQYGPIQPGETLSRIARSIKPEGVTLEQTLVALYRHNPDAFIKKNMNLVKSGKILRIPDASELASVPQREAAQEVHIQIADFHAFRARLADGAAVAREQGSATSGRISARVADAGTAEARDTVRLSKGEPPSGKSAGAWSSADRVRALEEEAVAREKALSEASDRIAQLEKTIKDMQRLADLKGGGATVAQQPAVEKSATMQPPPSAVKAPPSTASVIAQAPAKEAEALRKAPDAGKGGAPDAGKGQMKDVPDTAVVSDDGKAPSTQGKDGASLTVVKAKPATTPTAPAPAEDFLETVVNEPLYLAAGGAAVLLGGLGFAMALRRRKANKDSQEGESFGKRPPKGSGSFAATRANVATPAARAGATMAGAGVAAGTQKTQRTSSANEDDDLDFNGQRAARRSAAGTADSEATDDRDVVSPAGSPDLRVAHDPDSSEVPAESDDAQATALGDSGFAPERAPSAEPAEADFFAVNGSNSDEKPPEDIVRDFGLDLPDSDVKPKSGAPAAAEASAARSELSTIDFNLDSLPAIDSSGETVLADRVAAASEAPLDDFKLDDLDLSLGNQAAAGSAVKDDHWYDVQQKFDLAKAYEEMGDKDGARDILQEVVKEGDADQQTQARKLLETLS